MQQLAAACVRMKGLATSIDLQSLSFETRKMAHSQEKCFKLLRRELRALEKLQLTQLAMAAAPARASNGGETELPKLLEPDEPEERVLLDILSQLDKHLEDIAS